MRKKRKDSVVLRKTWLRARRAETQFSKTLRALARRCGELARDIYDPNDPNESGRKLRYLLTRYAETLQPWAKTVAERMVLDVTRRDEAVWAARSKEMAVELRKEIRSAPTGELLQQRVYEAANLITSLPQDAAIRVEKHVLRVMEDSARASEVAEAIYATGHVTKARANLIARTEVARTASELTRVRAEYVGAEGYIWRTAEDDDVRPRHRKLNGKYFRWDDPPVAGESGERAHAGQIYNCRCYPEPVLPEG